MEVSALVLSGQAAEGEVHWLPCKVHHEGPANAQAYFAPTAGEDGHLEASFRGRRLRGVRRELPQGYAGVVVAASSSGSDADAVVWQARGGRFTGLTYWNHDTKPTATDPAQRCLDFLVLADKAHAPVDPAAVERELGEPGSG